MDRFKVTIYIGTSFRGPSVRTAAGEWLIEYIKPDGASKTKKGIIKKDMTTENALALELLRDALQELIRPCSIRVNTECEHILNVMKNHWLSAWEKNDWHNAKGKPVKNAKLWQQCSEHMKEHILTFDNGENVHQYEMQEDMKKEMQKA